MKVELDDYSLEIEADACSAPPVNISILRKSIEAVAKELGIDKKIHKIIVVGHEYSGVELLGSAEGNVCVYLLNPHYTRENDVKHELMHPADILNPEFLYDFGHASKAAIDLRDESKINKENISFWALIATLWNINIDSRLEDKGSLDKRAKTFRLNELIMLLRHYGITKNESRRIFDNLWTPTLIPYPKLMKVADTIRMTHYRRKNPQAFKPAEGSSSVDHNNKGGTTLVAAIGNSKNPW